MPRISVRNKTFWQRCHAYLSRTKLSDRNATHICPEKNFLTEMPRISVRKKTFWQICRAYLSRKKLSDSNATHICPEQNFLAEMPRISVRKKSFCQIRLANQSIRFHNLKREQSMLRERKRKKAVPFRDPDKRLRNPTYKDVFFKKMRRKVSGSGTFVRLLHRGLYSLRRTVPVLRKGFTYPGKGRGGSGIPA
jgi:hypothetical protein